MTELKTLKDLKGYYENIISDRCVSKKELKAEAVKWYKDTEKDDGFMEYEDPFCCVPNVKSFIKMFFNLTEEDLK